VKFNYNPEKALNFDAIGIMINNSYVDIKETKFTTECKPVHFYIWRNLLERHGLCHPIWCKECIIIKREKKNSSEKKSLKWEN